MNIKIVVAAVIAGAAAADASAQTGAGYPQKPIRFIVPYAAGGGTDIIARAVATQMSAALGQQVVVDNRAGGGGLTGTGVVAKSPADGYTLLVTSGAPISVNISLFSKIPYDPIRDFTPISLLSTYSSFLVVHPSVPARSVKELIALAKARPGQLNFASGGFGTTQHLSAEMLKDMASIDIVHVPYKGGGQAILDLLGGHVSMFFGSGGSVLQHVRSGKARLLAVTSAKRSAEVPDVPTVAETLPGFESVAWVGLLAPAGTPRDVVARLNTEAVKALQNPDVRHALTAQDYGVVGSTPEEFVEYIRKDLARWASVIKKLASRPTEGDDLLDATLKTITDFTCGLRYEDLPPVAIHECKRRVLDTLACALGGFGAEPSKIARAVARRVTSDTPARIFGSLEKSSPELAAFANGVMIRYLDLNDATGSGGGHPSDALAALLAAAETQKTDGKTLILAFVIVYELYLGFFAANRIRNRGWDHVVYTVLAGAAGVARILKLDHATTANALSLALTPNMALEVVRRGQLTMWKGCAGGNAARNAVFAAQLAAEGMTGPAEVFEGEQGVWNAAGQFTWPPVAPAAGAFRVGDTQIKIYPCEYHGQSPIEATLAIRPRIDPREIAAIVVRTYWFAWSEIGSEPEKWEPTTRETADHSIPFLVSAALLDGKVDPATFTHARIFDPQLRELIRRVEVIYDKELDKLQPQSNPCRLEITLKSGEKISSSVDYPKGHVKNPASDADLERKLAGLAHGLLSPRQISALSELCWKLEEVDDVRELTSAMRL